MDKLPRDKAHYPGRVSPDPDVIYGPDTCGGSYEAVLVEYDDVKDRSTVYFKPYLILNGGD